MLWKYPPKGIFERSRPFIAAQPMNRTYTPKEATCN
jgi:hypothetical protein